MPRRAVISQLNNVQTLNDITPHHLEDLREFHRLARNIADRLHESLRPDSDDGVQGTIKLGYHAIPSLTPIHLHIISSDFDSSCIKTKTHIQSFTTSFFITPEELEHHLESAFVTLRPQKSLFVDVRRKCAEGLVKSPLMCTKCKKTALNVPDWKRHNQTCTLISIPIDGRELNLLLGWSHREYYGAAVRNAEFVDQLQKSWFSIFIPIADLGYYSWNPKHDSYKQLNTIQMANDILKYIDVDGMPDRLKPVVDCKVDFQNPNQTGFENRFPYGQTKVAGLHVATLVRVICLSVGSVLLYSYI
jgi:aprataxin